MKKKFSLLLCGVMLFAAPFFFSACEEKDESDDSGYDGTILNAIFGGYLQDIENYTGTFHFDEELSNWYAEDANHVRYYFMSLMFDCIVPGAEEGKQVQFTGELYAVSDKWLKEHESYRPYTKTGMYLFDMLSPKYKYVVDGKTYEYQAPSEK